MRDKIYPDYDLVETTNSVEISTNIRKKFGKYYYLTPLIKQVSNIGLLAQSNKFKEDFLKQFHTEAYKWIMFSKYCKATSNGVEIFKKDYNQKSERERLLINQ